MAHRRGRGPSLALRGTRGATQGNPAEQEPALGVIAALGLSGGATGMPDYGHPVKVGGYPRPCPAVAPEARCRAVNASVVRIGRQECQAPRPLASAQDAA